MTQQIDILLATYNGARFLPEQLQSLLDQTHREWRLIVRDDGSTDGSLELVKEWAVRNGVDLKVLDDGLGNLGACASFGKLLEASDAPYFACCDQDDVWLPEKLAVMLGALQQAEQSQEGETPILGHCDLVLVDQDLRQTAASFRQYASIARVPSDRKLELLLVQNVVTGCGSLGNAALRKLAAPIPETARMHDWWLALVAAEFGTLVDVAQPLALYRQHSNNTLGAQRLGLIGIATRFLRDPVKIARKWHGLIAGEQAQAAAFYRAYDGRLSPRSGFLAREYGRLAQKGFLGRRAFILRNRIQRSNPLTQLTFLLFA